MKLKEVKVEDVLAGKCWIMGSDGEADGNPTIRETIGFSKDDMGLVSAIVKFADGSEHPSLVVKSFPQGGDDIDIFIHTPKFGWMNIHSNGFMRAVGKYSHDIFPFDYFVANPWKGGKNPEPDMASPHKQIFRETAIRIKGKFTGPTPPKK
jgi:hypothetical protein